MKNNILDWDVAILLVANSIAWVLPFESNALLIIVCVLIAQFLLLSPKTILTFSPLPIICISLLVFLETFWEQPRITETWSKYLREFIALGIPSLYISRCNFDPYKVIRNIGIISIPMLPFVLSKNLASIFDYGFWMGISYGIVCYVVALIFLVFFHTNKELKRKYKIFFLVLLTGYTLFYIQFASRGTIVAVILSVILFTYIKYHIKQKKAIVIFGLPMLLLFSFWDTLLLFIINVLRDFGISSFAIEKMMSLQDMSNGRFDLIDRGGKIFIERPLFGHGVGIFEATYGEGYVHNCFVQFLNEGGIFYFSVMTFVILNSLKFILSLQKSDEIRVFMAFIFCTGFIQLLFSSYIWISQLFWFMIGYTLKLMSERTSNNLSVKKL